MTKVFQDKRISENKSSQLDEYSLCENIQGSYKNPIQNVIFDNFDVC